MRFLSIPEGILYLEEHGWVEQMAREWKDNGRTTTYADSVETKWNVSRADSAGLFKFMGKKHASIRTIRSMFAVAESIDNCTDAEPTTFAFADEYQRDGAS